MPHTHGECNRERESERHPQVSIQQEGVAYTSSFLRVTRFCRTRAVLTLLLYHLFSSVLSSTIHLHLHTFTISTVALIFTCCVIIAVFKHIISLLYDYRLYLIFMFASCFHSVFIMTCAMPKFCLPKAIPHDIYLKTTGTLCGLS